jgi:hypothetical protein
MSSGAAPPWDIEREFCRCRCGIAGGTLILRGQHRPGQVAWLVCEVRSSGEREFYLTDRPA